MDFGVPMDMQQLLGKKYGIMQQQANADTTRATAQANLQNQQAAMVKPLAESAIGLDNANAFKTREEGNMVKPMGEAQIDLWHSERDYNNMQTNFMPGVYRSQTNANNASAAANRVNSASTLFGYDHKLGAGTTSKMLDSYRSYEMGLKRGIARVPGKGEGDKVPAMLEPGEAVLNKHAAGMIGRDKIAKANDKGNQLRSKENLSKLAQAIKMMGMA